MYALAGGQGVVAWPAIEISKGLCILQPLVCALLFPFEASAVGGYTTWQLLTLFLIMLQQFIPTEIIF